MSAQLFVLVEFFIIFFCFGFLSVVIVKKSIQIFDKNWLIFSIK
jgi:hypothetical protein